MGWSVTVTMPEGNHPMSGEQVDEAVVSFALSPGSLACATEEVGFPRLPSCESPEQCMNALSTLIKELDKGDYGAFTNDWAVKADQQWSNGRESQEAWRNISGAKDQLPPSMNTYEKWTGHWKRKKLRDDAERFYLYYLAGCDVEFSW